MPYEQAPLWKRTLGSVGDEETGPFIERLRGAYIQFREAVKPVANDVALSVPGYTDHGIDHCDALWDTASLVTGQDFPLNPLEAFVLGGAFLVHDLGMGLSAYPGGITSILETTEWLDLLSVMFPNDHAELNNTAKLDIQRNPNWDGLTSIHVKEALTVYLRNNHARQAHEILTASWKLGDGTAEYLLGDSKMRAWYGDLIGAVARSHWTDVDELQTSLPSVLGALPGFPSDWTVDPLKIACILRVADAIQIDARRADPLHTPHRNPQGESLSHWQFQERFLSAQVTSGRLVFSSATGFTQDKIDAWWTAFDMVQMIDNELRRVDNLMGDLGKPKLLAHAVAGADNSVRFASFIAPDGWEPIDTRPHIGSPILLIDKLGGEALYGEGSDSGLVTVREILANALDATRALRLAYSEVEPKPIEVRFSTVGETDSITISDYGIGMNKSDVVSSLCDFGVSGWKGTSIRENFPGIVSHGFNPAGRFGIGFFSVFMASKRVKVTTRHFEAAKSDTLVLEFADGIAGRPIFRRANRNEQRVTPGTTVEIDLKHAFKSEKGMFSSATQATLSDDFYLPNFIGDLAFMSDETILVGPVNASDLHTAVQRNAWQTLPSEEVCDAIHSPTYRVKPGYRRMKTRFAHLLAPIEDSAGKLIGRLGVDAVRGETDDEYWHAWGQGHCGGLRSSFIPGVIGILSGNPTNAARDGITFDIPLDRLTKWYEDQLERVKNLDLGPRSLAEVQNLGISIGALAEELPFVFGKDGYLHPQDFREDVARRDRFNYVSTTGTSFEIDSRTYHGVTFDGDFALIPDGTFLADRRHYSGMRNLGLRANELAAECASHSRESVEFDPFSWWEDNYMNAGAELVRLAAAEWQEPLLNVVRSLKWLDVDESGDARPEFTAFSGTTRHLTALEVIRPPRP